MSARALAWAALVASAGCAGAPARESPPLATMEEPLELLAEPDDEARRQELPAGAFTGVYVADARRSLDAMLAEPEGVVVERLVENSPGEAAGLEPGDLLLEVELRAAGAAPSARALAWPSDWRQVELDARAGDELRVLYDRAGAEREARLVAVERVTPAARAPTERLREEQRVGVVLRAATEVEARAVGLAPGGGAVVVGLSHDSPWRAAGVRYQDLIVAVDGKAVAHPAVVLDAVRLADPGGALALELARGGERRALQAPVSRRAQELQHLRIPLLWSFERERDLRETSLLLGLFRWRRTPAAWDVRLLWLISFGGGDSDRLVEVGS